MFYSCFLLYHHTRDGEPASLRQTASPSLILRRACGEGHHGAGILSTQFHTGGGAGRGLGKELAVALGAVVVITPLSYMKAALRW